MNDLEKSILSTLVYYDVLDRPLTGWEVFKYLIKQRHSERSEESQRSFGLRPQDDKINNVLEVLENNQELAKFINQKNGLYFLKNRGSIIKKRIERQKISDQKRRKVKRIVRFLQVIPFVRLVAVSGSLAMNNTKEESDIDLLIITKTGRIWTCRGLITIFIHIIGQRRHSNLTKDRFCLNHYITDKSLKIPFQSLYNAQTYVHLIPFWQAESGLYNKFQKANKWIKDYLFFYSDNKGGYLKTVEYNQFFNSIRKFRESILDGRIGDVIEYILKRFQEKRIKKDPLTYQSGGRVIFNDQQLEFHPDSPEKWILKKYNDKMEKLGFPELGHEKDSGLI